MTVCVKDRRERGKVMDAYTADVEEQALEVTKLFRSKAQQSYVLIEDGTSEFLVRSESI